MVDLGDLSEPAQLLLLASLLAKDRSISHNGKAFLKELILRRDPRLLEAFAPHGRGDTDLIDGVQRLIDAESQQMYNRLFSNYTLEAGKTLSKTERERRFLTADKSLIYGEVNFLSFVDILRRVSVLVNPYPGGIFYDLGSGTGKAVFAARLTQDFSHCVGIEILESLHHAAQKVTARYERFFRPFLHGGYPQDVTVSHSSFLESDWSDGDVVFANSTCFPSHLMEKLEWQAELLKPGAVVITFTKGLSSKQFELLDKKSFRMSWGPATVFVHRRIRPDGKPLPTMGFSLGDGGGASHRSRRGVPRVSADEEEDEGVEGGDDDPEED
ncbi:unnamed protein product, partial [Discosporangium mesarthrocarpum]